jgi:hypothetical protein
MVVPVAVVIVFTISSQYSLQDLLLSVDANSPRPLKMITPRGDEVFLCLFDVNKPYAEICSDMGFQYTFYGYDEVPESSYNAMGRIFTVSFGWARVFMALWMMEE